MLGCLIPLVEDVAKGTAALWDTSVRLREKGEVNYCDLGKITVPGSARTRTHPARHTEATSATKPCPPAGDREWRFTAGFCARAAWTACGSLLAADTGSAAASSSSEGGCGEAVRQARCGDGGAQAAADHSSGISSGSRTGISSAVDASCVDGDCRGSSGAPAVGGFVRVTSETSTLRRRARHALPLLS